jgi:hypothetical protein
MEIFRALGALAEPPSDESARLGPLLGLGEPPEPGEYERLFVFQLYPWASVYLGAEGKLGGEARDRIGGFWRALELEAPDEPDHLTLMLGLYARLAELEADATGEAARQGWRQARKAWLWEHLLSWLPLYLRKLRSLASTFYRSWSETLERALLEEARELGPAEQLSIHLRQAPELGDPREGGGEGFLDQLLSPVRSGFIVLSSDLRDIARSGNLGLRAGERRYALEALLSQDAAATLDRLAQLARLAGYATSLEPPGDDSHQGELERFWRERAASTATLLDELAREAVR